MPQAVPGAAVAGPDAEPPDGGECCELAATGGVCEHMVAVVERARAEDRVALAAQLAELERMDSRELAALAAEGYPLACELLAAPNPGDTDDLDLRDPRHRDDDHCCENAGDAASAPGHQSVRGCGPVGGHGLDMPVDVLAVLEPGRALAAELDGLDLASLDDYALVEVLAAARRVESWAASVTARAAAQLSHAEVFDPARFGSRDPEAAAVPEEIALRLGITKGESKKLIALGRGIEGSFGATGRALSSGRIDARKAAEIVTTLAHRPGAVAWFVEQEVLGQAGEQTVHQLTRGLAKALIAVDAEDAAAAHARARRERHVTHPRPLPDGMASMYVVGAAQDLVGVDLVLDAVAAAAKAGGDPRSRDQLRADAFFTLSAGAMESRWVGQPPRSSTGPPGETRPGSPPGEAPDSVPGSVPGSAPGSVPGAVADSVPGAAAGGGGAVSAGGLEADGSAASATSGVPDCLASPAPSTSAAAEPESDPVGSTVVVSTGPEPGDQGTAAPAAGDQGTIAPAAGDQGTAAPAADDQGTGAPAAGGQGTAAPAAGDQGTAAPAAGDQGVAAPVAGEDLAVAASDEAGVSSVRCCGTADGDGCGCVAAALGVLPELLRRLRFGPGMRLGDARTNRTEIRLVVPLSVALPPHEPTGAGTAADTGGTRFVGGTDTTVTAGADGSGTAAATADRTDAVDEATGVAGGDAGAAAESPSARFWDDPPLSEVAELVGYGPVTADVARAIAAGGTWRRIVTDPLSGAVLDVGRRRYRPPADLAAYVRERDKTCIRPGCSTPATRCQLDHTVPASQGGATSAGNLGPACVRDHSVKTNGQAQVTQPEPGVFEWITPTGHAYRRNIDGTITRLPGYYATHAGDPQF